MEIIESLARKLSVSESSIVGFMHKCPRRYRQYEIHKRNNKGKRKIAQPTKVLKQVQRMVLKEHLADLPVHECATAYRTGKGIKDNALPHRQNSYLLKMDFEDFFNSICPSDLLAHLERERHGVSDNDKFAVRQLFFYQPTQHGPYLLSVGAPSSPFISNTILFEFDSQLSEYCKNEGIVYTRYADDLTFSTNEKGALFAIPNIVTKILAELPFPKIGINAEKTIFSSKRHNRHVTGLVITNDGRLSIGRSKKREIRSLIYQYLEDKLEVDRIGYLRGMLSYIADVEPNFLVSLERKYGKDKMVGLVKNI